MRFVTIGMLTVALGAGSAALVGCDSNDGTLEQAGEDADEAMEELGEGLEDAGKEIEDAGEEMGKKIEGFGN